MRSGSWSRFRLNRDNNCFNQKYFTDNIMLRNIILEKSSAREMEVRLPPRVLSQLHKCEKCTARWEEVKFYGLPPSALCRSCPRVKEWTGLLFAS
jgi:hypothetical protein